MEKNLASLKIICDESVATNFAIQHIENAVNKVNFSEKIVICLNKTNDLAEQEYKITKENKQSISIEYSFENGAMYALIDIANTIKTSKTLKNLKEGVVSPYVLNRGIKFNIPLDSRTPSYSDESDSAQKNIENMWDMDFWKTFIDELAKNKYNAISLWSLAPFPSMVYVEDYPLASIDDVKRTTRQIVSTTEAQYMSNQDVLDSLVTVKKITIHEKIAFWKQVMQYAHDKCVDFYVFTWNLFAYGTEGNPYGIDDNLDNPVTVDYFKKAAQTLVETYPLLRGVGVTSGERMSHNAEKDIPWIRNTYGAGVQEALAKTPERKFKFIHRLQYANIQKILNEYEEINAEFNVSVKYSVAHMYGTDKPKFTQTTIDALPSDVKVWLTVRNDDFYMFRWGDPDFARRYISNMPDSDILEGFFMGPDGYTWGREYISKDKDVYGKLIFEKMSYSFAIWGQVAFNPNLDDGYFKNLLAFEFGEKVGSDLFTSWSLSSSIFGEFIQTHWRNLDYHWNPESCCHYFEAKRAVWFCDINEFMECVSEPFTDRISVKDYCSAVLENREIEGVTPLETAKKIQLASAKSQKLVAQIENNNEIDKELNRVLTDIKALNLIGMYYGLKLESAVDLTLARKLKDSEKQAHAVELLEECSKLWVKYCDIVDATYIPQHLTRYKQVIDVKRFIEQTEFDVMFAKQEL